MIEKIRKGIRHPEKVPPYLARQGRRAVERGRAAAAAAATRWTVRGAPAQRALLDDLRADDEWLLVILDACRHPEFADLAPLAFEGSTRRMATAGHDTFEYARHCWDGQYPDVTYLSGATPINSGDLSFADDGLAALYDGYRPADHIGTIVDLWAEHWDESLGTVPAWHVTDAAEGYLDESRLVVHYFQPHAPYIGVERELGHANDESARPGEGEPIDAPLWRRIERGEIGDGRLRDLYRSNLELALAEAARLVEAAPHDRVVVAGDHGEALGEYGTYAHPRTPHPHVRTAPWMDVTGVADGWRDALSTPARTDETTAGATDEGTVTERLRDLGYV